MQISYQREFRHNYLIIDPEELIWQGYESQMLRKNPIEGLLRFQIRQIDEKVRFYYEITSRQPLVRILKNRNIQADEIRRLMLGIFGALERMDTFFLMHQKFPTSVCEFHLPEYSGFSEFLPVAEKEFSGKFWKAFGVFTGKCGSSG